MHARRARNRTLPNAADHRVRLRPVAGIAPGTYLTVLYGCAAAALLFATLVLPGLRWSGSVIEFTSSPAAATVSVDGRFAGVTPLAVRVAAGTRSVTVAKDYFHPQELSLEVGGRILLSWPLPRRDARHVELAPADAEGLLRHALLDLARNPTVARIVTDAAGDLALAGQPSTELGERLLRNAMLLIEDEAGLAALLAAHTRLAGGSPPSAAGVQRLLRDLARLAADSPSLPLWFAALLPREPRTELLASDWYGAAAEQGRRLAAEQPAASGPTEYPEDTVTAAGMVFHRIPAGTFVMGDARPLTGAQEPVLPFETWPHRLAVASFYLQQREVTKAAYARFVAERPEWSPGNRAALMARGVVAQDYLADWENGAPPAGREREPVVYVSAPAAEAFAAWVGEQLGAAPNGGSWQVRLPSEVQWEYAARGGLPGRLYPGGDRAEGHVAAPGAGLLPAGYSPPNGYGLQDMLGSVWEWTADWYSPTRYLFVAHGAAARRTHALPEVGSRRAVRGGAFTSDPRVVTVYTRGSQPAEWCTPVLGFRLALVRS
ncbi:MAG: SUMF1/EgtB/PvdO family nonheme iron enzyme [Spirochaetaceae bacterium]|nr:SUMF1/EgtB/PvdO family nonheme iron enzyme [Spirochaetaceae bacterium]